MSTSLDATTTTGQMRYLIGDTDLTKANFQDEDLAAIFNLSPDGSLYLACALALDSLANKAASKLNNIVLGTLKIDQTSKVAALKAAAAGFRDLEYNTPAFAIIEDNLSSMNELLIIRNRILRTET
jgi:hypothetical protein